ncbi:MAG: DUF4255 domain-containing protein [Bacteroidota bacterium]
MLNPFINYLKADLNTFISNKLGANGTFVLFTNLNNITELTQGVDNKIIISIANIEEEKMLKSPDNYIKTLGEIQYKKPPVWLNIVCLFSYYTRSHDDYEGIDLLANVVQYFQSKPKLDKSTVLIPENFPASLEEIRAELLSLNYEQTNYIWGLFGGKYYPSIVYKFKTIPIDNQDITPGGPPILEIDIEAKHKK